jgi:hypothetical protein
VYPERLDARLTREAPAIVSRRASARFVRLVHFVPTDGLRRAFAILIRANSSAGREGRGLDLWPMAAEQQISSINCTVARGQEGTGPRHSRTGDRPGMSDHVAPIRRQRRA